MKKLLLLLIISTFCKVHLNAQSITWADDIACIVYNKCSQCHHPEGVGPFSLMSYNDAYTFRGSIKNATSERRMPPWKASSGEVEYVDDLSLTTEQINLIAQWVDNGAPQGNPDIAPDAPIFENQEEIINPDVVIQFQEYTSQAEEEDDYRCFVESWPTNTPQWVVASEVVPGNTNIVQDYLCSSNSRPGYDCVFDNTSHALDRGGDQNLCCHTQW